MVKQTTELYGVHRNFLFRMNVCLEVLHKVFSLQCLSEKLKLAVLRPQTKHHTEKLKAAWTTGSDQHIINYSG